MYLVAIKWLMQNDQHKELSNFTPRKKKANEKVNAVLHIVVTGEFSIMIEHVPKNESEQPLGVG
jgi:hypothetical protein